MEHAVMFVNPGAIRKPVELLCVYGTDKALDANIVRSDADMFEYISLSIRVDSRQCKHSMDRSGRTSSPSSSSLMCRERAWCGAFAVHPGVGRSAWRVVRSVALTLS
jgi:hypothetical protein